MLADVAVLPSAAALADAAAGRFITAARDAIASHGQFIVALSGGSTPRDTYLLLGTEALVSRVMWSRVHVLWGDERCVPPDHIESNYRMARETLLDRVPIPAANVHRIHGEDDPATAAEVYEATLRALLRTPAGARIDLVLLGLGEDGHTASLFPGNAAVHERTRWVMAARASAASVWRITLTPAVINAAAEILFLVSGGAKAGILRRVLERPRRPQELPAQAIAPSNGRVRWCVDAAAAADLTP
ncbi:MAG TPA: 6-phosphogluconolactonase [Gemmatimonadales bacterium]|nr:6-phosphogluconolactonase [Gemmatimonadales bacterium]